MSLSHPPWVSGPTELLQHALELLERGGDANRRFAFIAIDNAVEVAAKTYLGLPQRVSKLSITREELSKAEESFPKLLDSLEKHCSDRLDGVNLGEIEWYHKLRNQLYHRGNGITVEESKVQIYSQLARLLLKNLFGVDVLPAKANEDPVAEFLESWSRIERSLHVLVTTQAALGKRVAEPRTVHYLSGIAELSTNGTISRAAAADLHRLRELRNQLVHGEADLKNALRPQDLSRLSELSKELQLLEDRHSGGAT